MLLLWSICYLRQNYSNTLVNMSRIPQPKYQPGEHVRPITAGSSTSRIPIKYSNNAAHNADNVEVKAVPNSRGGGMSSHDHAQVS